MKELKNEINVTLLHDSITIENVVYKDGMEDRREEIKLPSMAAKFIAQAWEASRIKDEHLENLAKCGFPYNPEMNVSVNVQDIDADSIFHHVEKSVPPLRELS